MTIGSDGHVALEEIVEFLLDVDGSSKLVVMEDGLNARLDGMGIVVWLHDNTKDLQGDGNV